MRPRRVARDRQEVRQQGGRRRRLRDSRRRRWL